MPNSEHSPEGAQPETSGTDVSRVPAETVTEFDRSLLAERALALAGIHEITPAATVGEAAGFEAHDAHTVTLFFACLLPGYPDWRWAASLTRVDADAPATVLEVELLPSEASLLAPDWLPWSDRLAQFQESQ
ncbi:DUF3027 domain-containing protein, partial [Leucobacter sp. M11]|uniref:DUF3027 domain-containing protein n=1 Tax=Leucobacter sp. M11 TaxID=2993565 RepID=UPI002D7F6947